MQHADKIFNWYLTNQPVTKIQKVLRSPDWNHNIKGNEVPLLSGTFYFITLWLFANESSSHGCIRKESETKI